MTNIREMLSTFLTPGPSREVPPLPLPEGLGDRLDHDIVGLSDSDAMWYYEVRRWRGRD